MAGKFIDLKEAARLLGVSPEQLVEMRSSGEIFGYRDGASWKFKTEEVDRVLAERSSSPDSRPGSDILGNPDDDFNDFLLDEPKSAIGRGSSGSAGSSDKDISKDVSSDAASADVSASDIADSFSEFGSDHSSLGSEDADSDDSILVSDDEPGSSGPRKSTVIGKDKKGRDSQDSDLKLGGSGKDLQGSGFSSSANVLSGNLSGDSMNSGMSSGMAADASDVEYEISPEDSGELSAGLSAGLSAEAKLPSQSLDGGFAGGASSDSIDLVGELRGSDVQSAVQSELHSAIEDDSILEESGHLDLGDTGTGINLDESHADIDLDLSGKLDAGELSDASMSAGGADGDSVDLDADSISLDDEPVSQGSKGSKGAKSDVTYRPSDSGINLASPSDSGISLEEEPLDLGGSAVEPMVLAEDDESSDDVIALEEEEAADADAATQLRQGGDEPFSLSPVEGLGDDESDSGSQVIALEDTAVPFGNSSPTMLKGGPGSPLVADGALGMGSDPGLQTFDIGGAAGMQSGVGLPSGAFSMPVAVEAPYSIMNVLGLMVTAGVLALSGLVVADLMLMMWSAHEPGQISTGIADGFSQALGFK